MPSGSQRPTVRSVADYVGVSRQTVSNVLNFPERVRPELRERVEKAIAELGFQPNQMARSLALSQSRLIAFRVGDGQHNEVSILDPFMRELARIGKESGYRLVLDYAQADDDSQIASYSELYARRAVDGVVFAETHRDDRRPAWLLEHNLPCVAFGRPWGVDTSAHSWVDVDMEGGITQAVQHLHKNGHRHIGYVGPTSDGARVDTRFRAWEKAAKPEKWGALAADWSGRGDEAAAFSQIEEALREHRLTAVVCHDDDYADYVVRKSALVGRAVGADLAVIGFDDSSIARRSQPPISSVKQPITEVAQLVWESLLQQLDTSSTNYEPLQQIVSPTLIVRDSSDFQIA